MMSLPLTHLAECKGTLVACKDLTGTTSREVKQFNQSGNHLILLLCVSQAAVTTKPPAEHSFLRIQHKLHTRAHC